MKKYLVLICLSCVLTLACSEDTMRSDCEIMKVSLGYNTEYFQEFSFIEKSDRLIKKTVLDILKDEIIDTIQYEFDDKGRLLRLISRAEESKETHLVYDYTNGFVYESYYTITDANDTIYTTVDKWLYLENPVEEKIYRYVNNGSQISNTFKDGNLYETGLFEVVENDTIDTFYQRYFFDQYPNSYYIPIYKASVPHEFRNVAITSKNNLIRIDLIGSDDALNYYFDYDSNNNLIRYKGKSGLTADIKYDCN